MDPVTEPAERADSQPTPPGLGRRMFGWLTESVLVIVGAIVIATLIRTFVGQMFIIPSGSMEHTLEVGDRVLVSKFGGFQRGDVVVFQDPGNWLDPTPVEDNPVKLALEFVGVLPNSSTEHLIKRVIGMPGDHVRTTDDLHIEVNGQVLDETPYLYADDGVQVAPATVPFDIVVPKDRIFVMGDHRNASRDSRCKLGDVSQQPGMNAFVPIDDVVGAAVAIVAPLDRLATFTVPETFSSVPAGAEAPDKPVLTHVEAGC
ncbi:MAG: signal peptidase I [Arachnia sp.]